jgi:hypothetical protein
MHVCSVFYLAYRFPLSKSPLKISGSDLSSIQNVVSHQKSPPAHELLEYQTFHLVARSSERVTRGSVVTADREVSRPTRTAPCIEKGVLGLHRERFDHTTCRQASVWKQTRTDTSSPGGSLVGGKHRLKRLVSRRKTPRKIKPPPKDKRNQAEANGKYIPKSARKPLSVTNPSPVSIFKPQPMTSPGRNASDSSAT